MNQAVDKLGNYFNSVISKSNGELNIKEVITGFTVDVIASTSFATETNANGDRSSKNVFLENSIGLLDFKAWILLSFFAMPKRFNRWVGAELGFNMKPFNFFVDLSRAILAQRKAENGKVHRTDLVQLMTDAFVYEDELQKTNYDKLTATADNGLFLNNFNFYVCNTFKSLQMSTLKLKRQILLLMDQFVDS